jgi:hypothetical protein
MKPSILFAALALVTVAAACTAEPEALPEASASSEALTGCHTVCPHCPNKPGTECPMAPCYEQCSDGNGHDVCPENQMCIQGYAWNPNACKCKPAH